MRRLLVSASILLALVLGGCADAQQTPEATPDEPTTTASEPGDTTTTVADEDSGATTTTDGDTSATTEPPATDEPPEGPLAPDFTLALGADGSESFTLSEEADPVYMVFWAEW